MPSLSQPKEDVYCTVGAQVFFTDYTLIFSQLLLNDAYLPGALVVASVLKKNGTTKRLAVLVVSSSVSKATISRLQQAFDYVIDVKKLTNDNFTALNMMGRPDLLATFTKIALWHQVQYRKIVYLDADTLPLRAPDELFDILAPFAAAPEIGFPDCFNSGVMVLEPNFETHTALLSLAAKGISFDGGDQGLLNIYFEDFHRLSFMYNVELYRTYRLYMPAMKHYREKLTVVHFIGKDKPWDLRGTEPVDESAYATFYSELLEKWWKVSDGLTVELA